VRLSPAYLAAVNRFYEQAAGGRALATLGIVYVADAQADAVMGPLREMARAEGYCTLIVVPFVNQGTAIGALALYHDAPHTYSPDPLLEGLDSSAYLAVPLQIQHRPIGVLVLWLFQAGQEFSPDDIALAEALADRAAVALENARLYERERQAQRAKDVFLSSI